MSISLRKRLEAAGLVVSGTSPDERLVEIIELRDHPFFVASQFHPEFKSRPERPAPLFREFVAAALQRAGGAPGGGGRRRERRGRAGRGRPPGLAPLRPASEVERRTLNEHVRGALRDPEPVGRGGGGRRPAWPASCARSGSTSQEDEAGNLLRADPRAARGADASCSARTSTPSRMTGPIEPVLVDGGWESAGDTILGADNKAAVAVLLAVAERVARETAPVGLELLFTVARGARAGGREGVRRRRRSTRPTATSSTTPRRSARSSSPRRPPTGCRRRFHGRAAHAGIRPEDGRSAIVAAARADRGDAPRAPRRRDDRERRQRSTAAWRARTSSPSAARCAPRRARSRPRPVESVVAEMVDHLYDAANDPQCECDVDVVVERLFEGYRHRPRRPSRRRRRGGAAARAATRRAGSPPAAASDANALEAAGLPCTNLANGTERNHEPTERVSVAALEGMLDVALALLDAAADEAAAAADAAS